MPPKARITREMIINAGLAIIRENGEESLNVRKIASVLGCSTQPVMYSYSSVEKLREDILKRAGEFHIEYIMKKSSERSAPMLGIGLNYIRFAQEERNLFRFLFQSGNYTGNSFGDMMSENAPTPVLDSLRMQTGITSQQAIEVFEILFACVHGFASFIANNALAYDEEYFSRILTELFQGMIGYQKQKGEINNESHHS